MEEIKEMLVNMQNQINDIQVSFEQKLEEDLQVAKEEIRNELNDVLKNDAREKQYLEEKFNIQLERLKRSLKWHEEDAKIQLKRLLINTETNRRLINIHDSEIFDIKQKQFENELKNIRLERKNIEICSN